MSGHTFCGNDGVGGGHALGQHFGAHFQVTETDRLQAQEIQRQRLDMIHRQRKTHIRERGQVALAFQSGRAARELTFNVKAAQQILEALGAQIAQICASQLKLANRSAAAHGISPGVRVLLK